MSRKEPTTKYVRAVVDLIFVGDYYDADECQGAALGWIDGTLGDRDDLRGWVTRVELVREAPGDPEGLLS